MLVIRRGFGEWIVLTMPDGRQIRLTLTKTSRGTAGIGIDAPKDVQIDRDEATGTKAPIRMISLEQAICGGEYFN